MTDFMLNNHWRRNKQANYVLTSFRCEAAEQEVVFHLSCCFDSGFEIILKRQTQFGRLLSDVNNKNKRQERSLGSLLSVNQGIKMARLFWSYYYLYIIKLILKEWSSAVVFVVVIHCEGDIRRIIGTRNDKNKIGP